jgi:hypothetical protein
MDLKEVNRRSFKSLTKNIPCHLTRARADDSAGAQTGSGKLAKRPGPIEVARAVGMDGDDQRVKGLDGPLSQQLYRGTILTCPEAGLYSNFIPVGKSGSLGRYFSATSSFKSFGLRPSEALKNCTA